MQFTCAFNKKVRDKDSDYNVSLSFGVNIERIVRTGGAETSNGRDRLTSSP